MKIQHLAEYKVLVAEKKKWYEGLKARGQDVSKNSVRPQRYGNATFTNPKFDVLQIEACFKMCPLYPELWRRRCNQSQ
jgi:hypothetical protein